MHRVWSYSHSIIRCTHFGSSRYGTVIGDALLDRSGVQTYRIILAIAIVVEYRIELSKRLVAS